jgi:hypothetical protein
MPPKLIFTYYMGTFDIGKIIKTSFRKFETVFRQSCSGCEKWLFA